MKKAGKMKKYVIKEQGFADKITICVMAAIMIISLLIMCSIIMRLESQIDSQQQMINELWYEVNLYMVGKEQIWFI